VVRVGEHVSDFEVDAEMSEYSSSALPIPIVSELDRLEPPHDQLFICVSTFAPGRPLEEVSPDQWAGLVPAVADLLEAMRSVKGPPSLAWPQTLLAAPIDEDGRLQGWQSELARRPLQQAGYEQAMDRLGELSALPHVADVEATLLHCDLVNRNVHIDDGVITGVFDWGCRRWGDHLYDLAWFDFWSPWIPNLDVELLRSELIGRWGEAPDPDRYAACLLHIGADHLVYNAVIGDPEAGRAVLDRLTALQLL
jgi:hypothetical protein